MKDQPLVIEVLRDNNFKMTRRELVAMYMRKAGAETYTIERILGAQFLFYRNTVTGEYTRTIQINTL